MNTGLSIGQVITNDELTRIFGCSPQGGMRKSNTNNALVIVANYVDSIYKDYWIGNELHYIGMGQNGDQSFIHAQNRTLNESETNGVEVHLFEVFNRGEYSYCGTVSLSPIHRPYTDRQRDASHAMRNVCVFPLVFNSMITSALRPEEYSFNDQEDYEARHMDRETEYNNYVSRRTRSGSVRRRKLIHVTYGEAVILSEDDYSWSVRYDEDGRTASLNKQYCEEHDLIIHVDER